MELNENNTLGEWVSTFAGVSQVFIRNNLDFCCGGSKSLKDACESSGINIEELMKDLKEAAAGKTAPKWNLLGIDQVVDDILEIFHKKHRDDLQMLIPLAKKVETVHASSADCPKGLADFLETLQFELESHMQKEEQILFPMIKSGRGMMAEGPIQVMMHEHISHIENLAKLKELAKNYILPNGACGSWTALYKGVENLEKEIKEHIATENNILFPKVLNG
ncbi:MAG: iron-sulfur cluster repair di-iron protein [Bdellovibrionales bacterium RBG_16_40_8]|nr:MAG: iron-sulfur cluster repair di-iron protein [Bdellovibrionales bacterium RBG_16_40_8]